MARLTLNEHLLEIMENITDKSINGNTDEGFYRGNKARSLDTPLSTVTASRGFGGIVSPVADGIKLDIRFRMLKNHELKKAQGFPDEYKITGNLAEQTKQIGNAVPVNTAKALAKAAMSV